MHLLLVPGIGCKKFKDSKPTLALLQKRILGSFQSRQLSKFNLHKAKGIVDPGDVIFLMWGVWWKLENCFSFLWKQMFKGAATDSILGQFFPTGKTISLCSRCGIKAIFVTFYNVRLSNVGQKTCSRVVQVCILIHEGWGRSRYPISIENHVL